MNMVFNDNTPFWKILSISFISGLGVIYPFLKNGKNFSINKVKKKQKRSIKIHSENLETDLKKKIIEQLKIKKFRIIKSDLNKIVLKSKWNINTFGEKYVVNLSKNEITVESVLKFDVFPLDGGIRYEQTNLIENEISKMLDTSKKIILVANKP